MEEISFWDANRFSASQEIPRILQNPKVHYQSHKCPPPVPITEKQYAIIKSYTFTFKHTACLDATVSSRGWPMIDRNNGLLKLTAAVDAFRWPVCGQSGTRDYKGQNRDRVMKLSAVYGTRLNNNVLTLCPCVKTACTFVSSKQDCTHIPGLTDFRFNGQR